MRKIEEIKVRAKYRETIVQERESVGGYKGTGAAERRSEREAKRKKRRKPKKKSIKAQKERRRG